MNESHEDLDERILQVVALDPDPPLSPFNEAWELIADSFGHPRTKTENAMFAKVVRELMAAGASPEEIGKTCDYVLARFDNPSVMSLCKWMSVAIKAAPKLSAQEAEFEKLRLMR